MAGPLKKFRAGAITCALWENEMQLPGGGKKALLKATVERRYKDKNDTWKSSNSFGRNEIPLVKWCLDKAFTAMIEEQNVQPEGKVDQEVVH